MVIKKKGIAPGSVGFSDWLDELRLNVLKHYRFCLLLMLTANVNAE